MNTTTTRAAWYRFRATFARRWGGYLSVLLLIGLIGGVGMASLAGARRTESSFSQLLASTHPSDLALITGLFQPAPSGYDPVLIAKIARLPYVKRIESQAGYESTTVGADGRAIPSNLSPGITLSSSIDGVFFSMDRLIVTAGRMPNPHRRYEVAMTADAAHLLGVHLGGTYRVGVVGDVQSMNFCQTCRPIFHARVTVVGIVTTSNNLIVDDTDRSPTIYATPAFTRPLLKCCVDPTISSLQIVGGAKNIPRVESEISRILPPHFPRLFTETASRSTATAQRVIGPDALALGIFGFIVALVALLIAGQLISRQLRLGSEERHVLRALGARPSGTTIDGLVGIILAIVAGSLLAGVVAYALSPLMPIGPVQPVYPTPGLAFDPFVIGLGVLALVVILVAIAWAIAVRQAPHRMARRSARGTEHPSSVVRLATKFALPVAAVCGIRFALVPGHGRRSAPVRSAVIGAVVAVTVVVATLTVGSSLNNLIARPALYGWNWTVAIDAAGGVGVLPQRATVKALNADPDVTAWSGMYFAQLQLNGQSVPVQGASLRASVAPPLLSGHGVNAANQIVLGAATMRQFHLHLGSTVRVASEQSSATSLVVVGTATLPSFGGNQHTELGVGAIVDYHLIPPSARNLFNLPGGGPNVVVVRLRDGATPAALARLHKLTLVLEQAAQDSVNVVPVQRPAEIANAGTLRATPSYLALALVLGAVIALALILIATVRRRRRDLALLKALGFTQRQLAAVVAWQSTVAAVIGIVVGVPLGIIVGRALWTLFAQSINTVPATSVPVWSVMLTALGALIFAVLVAVVPGRHAARTPTALVLRAE